MQVSDKSQQNKSAIVIDQITSKQKAQQLLRYFVAVISAPVIGVIAAIPFSYAIDILWELDADGRWPLTFPNIFFTVIQGLAIGFAAGWIAGRRGKLIAAFANFLPLELLIVTSIVLNHDLLAAETGERHLGSCGVTQREIRCHIADLQVGMRRGLCCGRLGR